MATKKKRLKDTPEQQHKRFVETAKEAGADERPEAMKEALQKIDIRKPVARHQRKA